MGASPFFDEGGLPALKCSHLEETLSKKIRSFRRQQ